MEFVPVVAMLALIAKIIDFLRYARAGDANGVFTQLAVWLAGVGVVLLVAQTDWADGIPFAGQALSNLNFWSLIFVGLAIGSAASLTKDTLKSVDNHNTSAIPTLLPSSPAPTRDPGHPNMG